MPPKVTTARAVTALTPNTAHEIVILRKNIIVEAKRLNNGIVYVAYTEDTDRPALDNYEPFGPNEAKFYSAKKGEKIMRLWVYATVATQYIDITASDSSIGRLLSHDFSEYASIGEIVRGLSFTERWEQGFDPHAYYGRVRGGFFKSEAAVLDRTKWTTPPIVLAGDTIETAPWDNAVSMRNSIDGTTIDELYVALPRAYTRARFRLNAKLPTAAQIGATGLVAYGFETNSQGATAAFVFQGYNSTYKLAANYLDPVTGGAVNDTLDITALMAHLNAWSEYHLCLEPPFLRLYEYNTAAWTLLGSLPFSRYQGDFWLQPFVCNESTAVLSNFQIGTMALTALEEMRLKLLGQVSQLTSAAAFATALKIRADYKNKANVHIKEHNTNDIEYTILGSNDDVTYETLVPTTDLAKNASKYEILSEPWLYINVQIRDNVAATHGKADISIGGN
jgi:hypothetical protein